MKKAILLSALAAVSFVATTPAFAEPPIDSVLNDIGPNTYQPRYVLEKEEPALKGPQPTGLSGAGKIMDVNKPMNLSYEATPIEGFSYGLYGGAGWQDRYVDMWQNGTNPREGSYSDFSGEFGMRFRYYDGISLGNARRQRTPIYINTEFGGVFGDGRRKALTLYHFGNGNDTGIAIDEQFRMRLGLGARMAMMQEAALWLIGGFQLSRYSFTGFTDETSGSGVINDFMHDAFVPGGYFGVEYQTPLRFGNLPKAQLSIGATASRTSSREFTGTSTLGNTYRFDANPGWGAELKVGIDIPFKHNF